MLYEKSYNETYEKNQIENHTSLDVGTVIGSASLLLS